MPNPSARSTPTADQYRKAVQNPQVCFLEEQLQQGQVATDTLGLPMVASGNFAVVFRLQRPNAPDVAIRCFTRSITDHKRRYRRISQTLDDCRLSAFVEFSYLEKGICVDGNTYPLLQMDWAPGVQLDQYIKKHSRNSSRLHSLADRWHEILAELENHRISHGDLSDGNVLVDQNGRIRLVDYDGMFVPSLANDPPQETGKPNFQHPERLTNGHYGPNSDSFPGLVIYLSLKAVAAQPQLWDQYYKGENLLLEQKDFEEPGRTAIWGDLRSVPDREVQRLTDTLADWCQRPVANLPLVSSILGEEESNGSQQSHSTDNSSELRRIDRLYRASSSHSTSSSSEEPSPVSSQEKRLLDRLWR